MVADLYFRQNNFQYLFLIYLIKIVRQRKVIFFQNFKKVSISAIFLKIAAKVAVLLFFYNNLDMSAPFVITLIKNQAGYIFHSIEEPANSNNQQKQKKLKAPLPKTHQNKTVNRLIKQISLLSQGVPPPPEAEELQDNQLYNDDADKNQNQNAVEEEQINCQIKRKIQLLPSPASWFSLSSIHDIQKKKMSEFFTQKGYKSAQLYINYRNFIVEAYRKNPLRYLTFISCRRVLRGDVSCLLRIYKFLNTEGIINYSIGIDGNYTFANKITDKSAQMSHKPFTSIKKLPQQNEEDTSTEINTDNLTLTVINKNFSRTFRVYCTNCKLICGVVWYSANCDEEKQKNICFECFQTLPKQEAGLYSKVDIIKKIQQTKDSKNVNKSAWNIEDNMKLLDYMSKTNNQSWSDLISQFDGKKALEDIIVQFLQFPITNFEPSKHLKSEEPPIQTTLDQHINMIQGIYLQKRSQASSNIKTETQMEESEQGAKKFKNLTKNILLKYNFRINYLKSVENILQQSNLSINQQTPCKRIRIPLLTQLLPESQSPNERNNESDFE